MCTNMHASLVNTENPISLKVSPGTHGFEPRLIVSRYSPIQYVLLIDHSVCAFSSIWELLRQSETPGRNITFCHMIISLLYKFTRFFIYFLFLSDEGPMFKTLDYTICIGSTPTFLYFDLLYGSRDGMFAVTGRFSSRVYMRMFLPGTISPGTICKVSIISSQQSGTECLYDKNCPALAGLPPGRDEKRPGKILSI